MLNVVKICSPELKGAHQVRRWQWTRLCSLTFCLLSLNILILVRICVFFHSDEMHTFFFFPLLKPTLLKPIHPQSPIVLAALKADFSGFFIF